MSDQSFANFSTGQSELTQILEEYQLNAPQLGQVDIDVNGGNISAINGNINMNNAGKLINTTVPINPNDSANKLYVDSAIGGIPPPVGTKIENGTSKVDIPVINSDIDFVHGSVSKMTIQNGSTLQKQNIDMQTFKIENISDSVLANGIISKGTIDTALGTKANTIHTHLHTDVTDFDTGVQQNTLNSLNVPNNDLNMNNFKIGNLTAGVTGLEATNLTQVQNLIAADTKAQIVNGTSNVVVQSSGGNVLTNIGGNLKTTVNSTGLQLNDNIDINANNIENINETLYNHITTPANPAVGKNKIYFKNDEHPYIIDNLGNEEGLTHHEVLSTGLKQGGILSINGGDDTKFDISDGSGLIVDNNLVKDITWTGLTAQSYAYSGILTWITINNTGTVTAQSTKPTPQEKRERIVLGVVVHVNGINIVAVNNEQQTIKWPVNSLSDFCDSVGFLNTTGNILSSPASNLTFAKSVGTMFGFGINNDVNEKSPHIKTLPVVDLSVGGIFQYRMRDGTSSAINLTAILPNTLDDGTAYPGTTMSNNKWGTNRVYCFVSGVIKIQPPQFQYSSQLDAYNAIFTEGFITEPSISENGLLIGYIVVQKGETNLDNASFYQSGKFGGTSSGGGVDTSALIHNDGSVPMIADLSCGGNQIISCSRLLSTASSTNYSGIDMPSNTVLNVITHDGANPYIQMQFSYPNISVSSPFLMNSNNITSAGNISSDTVTLRRAAGDKIIQKVDQVSAFLFEQMTIQSPVGQDRCQLQLDTQNNESRWFFDGFNPGSSLSHLSFNSDDSINTYALPGFTAQTVNSRVFRAKADVAGDGTITCFALTQTSTRDVKQKIKPIKKITGQPQAVKYHSIYDSDKKATRVGYIAEDVHDGIKNGTLDPLYSQSVKYIGQKPIALDYCQIHTLLIEQQKQELDELKSRIMVLEKLISKIK